MASEIILLKNFSLFVAQRNTFLRILIQEKWGNCSQWLDRLCASVVGTLESSNKFRKKLRPILVHHHRTGGNFYNLVNLAMKRYHQTQEICLNLAKVIRKWSTKIRFLLYSTVKGVRYWEGKTPASYCSCYAWRKTAPLYPTGQLGVHGLQGFHTRLDTYVLLHEWKKMFSTFFHCSL